MPHWGVPLFDVDLPEGFRYLDDVITVQEEPGLAAEIARVECSTGPGAPIGWHRDAPQYGVIAGLSLLSSCRMKLRPDEPPAAHTSVQGRKRIATHTIALERRSVYLMSGQSRNAYEHHIPAVTALRYSITFRTVRQTVDPQRH